MAQIITSAWASSGYRASPPVAPGPVGAGGEGDRSPAGGSEKGDPVQPESGAEYEDQEIGELG